MTYADLVAGVIEKRKQEYFAHGRAPDLVIYIGQDDYRDVLQSVDHSSSFHVSDLEPHKNEEPDYNFMVSGYRGFVVTKKRHFFVASI